MKRKIPPRFRGSSITTFYRYFLKCTVCYHITTERQRYCPECGNVLKVCSWYKIYGTPLSKREWRKLTVHPYHFAKPKEKQIRRNK